MPDWFGTPEIEDITLTAKALKDETIARNPEIRAVRVNIQPHSIQGPSNPLQRDFAGPLRSRHNMSVGRLAGSATDLESSPTLSVRELVDRFEGGAQSSIRPSHPFKNELIKKAQAQNLSLFESLEPSFNLANYPEYAFQGPSLSMATHQLRYSTTAPSRVPVQVVRPFLHRPPPPSPPPPPPPPPPSPSSPLVFQSSDLIDQISRILERRGRGSSYSDSSDGSFGEYPDEWSD